jgi:signal transduction histidine kinase
MTNTFVFEPSARLQRLLSRELISDPNLAVVELVKNGYDAGATKVRVHYERDADNISLSRLTVADNGHGMSSDEFRVNWMRPGYSDKARDPGKPIKVQGKARVPAGEKGLGRLAAGRLGESLTVYTRKRRNEPWFQIEVDWRRFENMEQDLRDVELEGARIGSAPRGAFNRGTVLVIEEMTVDLGAGIPGRKAAGRPDNRFGRLSQDLQLLTTATAGGPRSEFTIELTTDDPDLEQYAGIFEGLESLAPGQFRYDFSLRQSRSGFIVSRQVIQGSADSSTRTVLFDVEGSLDEVGELPRVRHPPQLTAGPLRGTFTYAPPIRGQKVTTGVPSGVFLYRDGVRVEPYGEPESDWLGAYSRKASRQGYAPIQPKFLYGAVYISRGANSGLIDISNRQGLLENEASANLFGHVRAEFAFFEQVIQDHLQSPRWQESQARKRQSAAQERLSVTRVQSRSLAHSVRQPLTGISAELFILDQIIRDDRIPTDLTEKLRDLRARLGRAASDISERVQTFLQAGEAEVVDFALADAFAEAITRVRAIAASTNARVSAEPTSLRVTFARNVLLEALAELVTNAIAAEPVPGRRRLVTLGASSADRAVEVVVEDNGSGLPEPRSQEPFEVGMSSSGRPGHGLVMQKLNLLGAGADLRLLRSSPDGAAFIIHIPQSAAMLDLGGAGQVVS